MVGRVQEEGLFHEDPETNYKDPMQGSVISEHRFRIRVTRHMADRLNQESRSDAALR